MLNLEFKQKAKYRLILTNNNTALMKNTNAMMIKKTTAVLFISLFLSVNIYAQQDNTIHLIPVIPQSAYTNPAFNPTPKLYIGFPALSSLNISIGHSGFAYSDLFTRRADDSLEITVDKVIEKLGKTNHITANINEEIIAFGFKAKKNYFSFNITEKVAFRFTYPRDLIKLAWEGNGQFVGSEADFSGIGLNASYYREYGLGYSREIKIAQKDFVVGGRLKFLYGKANIYTEQSNINLGINDENYAHTINTQFLINFNLPDKVIMELDSLGKDSFNNTASKFDFGQFLLNKSNKGMAIDLGIFHKLNNKFSFGLSLIDLGYINWKPGEGNSIRNYSCNINSYTFDGIDFINDTAWQDHLSDTLNQLFHFTNTKNEYKIPLPSRIYLSGIYSINSNNKVGLLFRNEFFDGKYIPAVTASFNKRFGRMFSASAAYSIMNKSYTNLGFGMALNLGPFQTYVTSDNLSCLFAPTKTKNVNIHFGINYVFGLKEKKPTQSLFEDTPEIL